MTKMQPSVKRAIEIAGSQVRLAEIAHASPAFVWQWRVGKRQVPVVAAVRIDLGLGISRRDLRPDDWGDIWPELINAEHPWPPVAAETTQEAA
jgi:DNA-binding transcriptional regulator YdaS (Cro superfamily)